MMSKVRSSVLGEKTYRASDEEVAGHMWQAPEYKKEVVASATDREWFGGDTFKRQSVNIQLVYTSIQFRNYAANNRKRRQEQKVNLIKLPVHRLIRRCCKRI